MEPPHEQEEEGLAAIEAGAQRIVRANFATYGHVRFQLDGYNHFLSTLLPSILLENSTILISNPARRVRHKVQFGTLARGAGVRVGKPVLAETDGEVRAILPSEARLRHLTYGCAITVDMVHTITTYEGEPDEPLDGARERAVTVNERLEVPLFSIPCMVKSRYCHLHGASETHGECPLDSGGYFIVNGNEKVLVSQSKLRTNKPYVWPGRGAKRAFEAVVRSCHETKWRSTSTLKVFITPTRPPELYVLIPFVMRGSTPLEVPLAAFVRALGLDADGARDALLDEGERADVNELVEGAVLDHAMFAMGRDEVLRWIGEEGVKERTVEKKLRAVQHIFLNEVLPHCGMRDTPGVWRKKAAFLGMCVRRLVSVSMGHERADDRDHNANKRLDGPGPLLAVLFRQLFRNHLKSFKASLEKFVDSGKQCEITDHINFRKITSQLAYHFATGNWSVQSKTVNTGVVQILSRMSAQAALSHLRRMSTPINRDGKNSTPRQLHPSEYGIFCPSESPEGAGCGLIKNLALLTHLTIGVPPDALEPALRELGVRDGGAGAPVFINGNAVGRTPHAAALVARLRAMRRSGDVTWELSVVEERRCVFCYVDAGRCTRPLFVLERCGRLPQILAATVVETELWGRLMAEGVVEYLDKMEEESWAVVATGADDVRRKPPGYFTHVEVDKLGFLSLTVASIPFSDRNQAPRNMYQAAMGKQALSIPTLTFHQRMSDTHQFVNTTAAKPLVDTYVGRLDSVSELTRGTEMIVAIMAYTGFNQEDSTIWNRAAIERGLGCCTYYHTYRAEITSRGTAEDEVFARPEEHGPEAVSGLRAGANYGSFGGSTLGGSPDKACKKATSASMSEKLKSSSGSMSSFVWSGPCAGASRK